MADFRYLERFINFEKNPGDKREFHLGNMRRLLEDFGNPHEQMKLIHVAGSKGKGSTAAAIATILAEALASEARATGVGQGGSIPAGPQGVAPAGTSDEGNTRHSGSDAQLPASGAVGIYASPHVTDYRERIRCALPGMTDYRQGFFDDDLYERQIDRIKNYMEGPGHVEATTFELLTLLAFLVFQAAGLSAAVIEVGLGGRLDSTNVITPILSVITPIEVEHRMYLGDSISQVAAEKAGIVKEGIPLLLGELHPDADEVAASRAATLGAPLHRVGDFSPVCTPGDFPADFQRQNSETAAAACRILSMEYPDLLGTVFLPDSRIRDILKSVQIPGRFELRRLIPHGTSEPRSCILDAAHTPQSLELLLSGVAAMGADFDADALTVIFSCLEDKDYRSMLDRLLPSCTRLIITGTGNFKRSDIPTLYEYARDALSRGSAGDAAPRLYCIDDPCGALNEALRAGTSGGILVCGSFYLLGELYAYVQALSMNEETHES